MDVSCAGATERTDSSCDAHWPTACMTAVAAVAARSLGLKPGLAHGGKRPVR